MVENDQSAPAAGHKLGRGPAPLMVGIVGRRDLHGKEKAVATALDLILEDLDKRFPNTPKVLLSSLAEGADSVAAQTALKRPGWSVVAPLPLSADLYLEDFSDSESAKRFLALSSHPRVKVIELKPLLKSGKTPYASAELHRSNVDNPDRTRHYEQAALFIVERAEVLIAVFDPSQGAGRLGGTQRSVKVRLKGDDTVAADLRACSRELLAASVLEEPRAGSVICIDLKDANESQDAPLEISLRSPDERVHPWPAFDEDDEAFRLCHRLEDFNRRAIAFGAAPSGPIAVASDAVQRLRDALRTVQSKMKRRVQVAVVVIAALFLIAVTALELHIGLARYAWAPPLSVVYCACALGAALTYLIVSFGRWQTQAEDYRAVSEALRVQNVLWRCGLTDLSQRVDQAYLRGATGSMALTRRAVGLLVEGARLPHAAPQRQDQALDEWIASQIIYFKSRIKARQGAVRFSRVVSWRLFVAGLFVSVCFAGMQIPWSLHHLHSIVDEPFALNVRIGLVIASSLVALVLLFSNPHSKQSPHGQRPFQLTLFGAAAGLLVTLALLHGAALLPETQHDHHGWRHHQAEELLVIGAVLTAAIAGAIRFVAEKLSLEAELDGYERALASFERAERKLKSIGSDEQETKTQLLVQLATEALVENQAWLAAHRERPVEPVVGA